MIGEWELVGTPPGAWTGPEAPGDGAPWVPAVVPGTVAQALQVDLAAPGDLDAQDWWYRTMVTVSEPGAVLCFDGLATLAEVWVDGVSVLRSRNMFVPARVEGLSVGEHLLVIVFRSVAAELGRKRPRPRWKTALVEQQNLRWIRTSLLGRIPGWTPAVPAIGPWRAVRVEDGVLRRRRVHPSVVDGVPRLQVEGEVGPGVTAVWVSVAGGRFAATLRATAEGAAFDAAIDLPGVPLWWPHTHGTPHLEALGLELDVAGGVLRVDAGRVGFRTVEVDTTDGAVCLRVNGRPIFARGACWTAEDVRAVDGDPTATATSLSLLREAGGNMVRVGGTMVWGSDAFYQSCDTLGILVWQDFMFANMDYPFADAAFAAEVEAEIHAQLGRLCAHACVAVYCGGSEIEQQAAMLGLPPEEWSSPFFQETAPALLARLHPGTAWFPSTPTGGALPFHTGTGLTHYYGVGAYLRPLTDARRAGVRFTPECLGFSNVPDAVTTETLLPGGPPPPHHPAWKAGIPRDNGAGWDFEDVRDHYLQALFGVDPVALRAHDAERWRALSRVTTGEVMARTFAEWRRPGSGCGGALVWFWKDLRPGAGWGLIDHLGRPKPVWWYLRRAWARRTVLLTDEGLDGVGVHVINETELPFTGSVEILLLQHGRRVVAEGRAAVSLAPFTATTLSGDALVGRFTDLTWSYRFGPPGHEIVAVRLRDADGGMCGQDVLFPNGHTLAPVEPGSLGVSGERVEGGVRLTLETPRFLQSVSIAAPGYTPDDDGMHLLPGTHTLLLRGDGRPVRAWITGTNLEGGVGFRLG